MSKPFCSLERPLSKKHYLWKTRSKPLELLATRFSSESSKSQKSPLTSKVKEMSSKMKSELTKQRTSKTEQMILRKESSELQSVTHVEVYIDTKVYIKLKGV